MAGYRRRLYLMRHGHVDYLSQPPGADFTQIPLTDQGVEQARAVGDALANVAFDRAICSGLPRARQTATHVIAANDTALALAEMPEFSEIRGGVPNVSGDHSLAEILALAYDRAGHEEETFLPGGEAFTAARARVFDGLRSIFSDRDWRTALLVAHEGINRIILAAFCGLGLHGMARFEQDFGCFNVLDIDIPEGPFDVADLRASVKSLNVTPYDPGKVQLTRTAIEHVFDIDFGATRPIRR